MFKKSLQILQWLPDQFLKLCNDFLLLTNSIIKNLTIFKLWTRTIMQVKQVWSLFYIITIPIKNRGKNTGACEYYFISGLDNLEYSYSFADARWIRSGLREESRGDLSATRLCSQAERARPEAFKFTYNFTANFSIFIPIIYRRLCAIATVCKASRRHADATTTPKVTHTYTYKHTLGSEKRSYPSSWLNRPAATFSLRCLLVGWSC